MLWFDNERNEEKKHFSRYYKIILSYVLFTRKTFKTLSKVNIMLLFSHYEAKYFVFLDERLLMTRIVYFYSNNFFCNHTMSRETTIWTEFTLAVLYTAKVNSA